MNIIAFTRGAREYHGCLLLCAQNSGSFQLINLPSLNFIQSFFSQLFGDVMYNAATIHSARYLQEKVDTYLLR